VINADAYGCGIIGKQGHGPTGTLRLQFEAEATRFANLAEDEQLPERM
jgi:replicative DNA helicase